jgi:hypothetical protein
MHIDSNGYKWTANEAEAITSFAGQHGLYFRILPQLAIIVCLCARSYDKLYTLEVGRSN